MLKSRIVANNIHSNESIVPLGRRCLRVVVIVIKLPKDGRNGRVRGTHHLSPRWTVRSWVVAIRSQRNQERNDSVRILTDLNNKNAIEIMQALPLVYRRGIGTPTNLLSRIMIRKWDAWILYFLLSPGPIPAKPKCWLVQYAIIWRNQSCSTK
jgi:hypothetical protein